MFANHDLSRAICLDVSISTLDRKIIIMILGGIGDFSSSEEEVREGEEASSEFYIPLETKARYSRIVHTRISWRNRSVSRNVFSRKRSKTKGNNPSEGGPQISSRWRALGVFGECADYDIIGIIDGHDLPRLRRGSPQRFAPTILIYG